MIPAKALLKQTGKSDTFLQLRVLIMLLATARAKVLVYELAKVDVAICLPLTLILPSIC